jgi:hypothetical protein
MQRSIARVFSSHVHHTDDQNTERRLLIHVHRGEICRHPNARLISARECLHQPPSKGDHHAEDFSSCLARNAVGYVPIGSRLCRYPVHRPRSSVAEHDRCKRQFELARVCLYAGRHPIHSGERSQRQRTWRCRNCRRAVHHATYRFVCTTSIDATTSRHFFVKRYARGRTDNRLQRRYVHRNGDADERWNRAAHCNTVHHHLRSGGLQHQELVNTKGRSRRGVTRRG